MARDAYYFLIPLGVLTSLVLLAGWRGFGLCMLMVMVFVAFFFRDPERVIPQDPNEVVSPADGRVIRVDKNDQGTLLSIFLSIFDVHVNRAPVGGVIIQQRYCPGKFLMAFDSRASVENEQLEITIGGSRPLTFTLIAGLVARRIISWKKTGEQVEKGDRIGLIRFGSRVDVLIPLGCELVVKQGERVYGGRSVIARWGQVL